MSQKPGDTFPFGQEIVWQPNPEWIKNSNLQQFMDRERIASYDEFLKKSVDDPDWFWNAVLRDLDIQFYRRYRYVYDTGDGFPFTRWCIDGVMNIVHNCLDKWQDGINEKRTALIWESENGEQVDYTYRDLFREVDQCSGGLLRQGFQPGDVAAFYMPMVPELLIGMLSVIKLGGIVLPLFSGYGPSAIETRLRDSEARFVFTSEFTIRRGREIAMKPVMDEALTNISTVEKVFVVSRSNVLRYDFVEDRDVKWDDIFFGHLHNTPTARTDAEAPMMLIYTSGTTGKPKGAVHTHCGFPIKAAQDMYQCMDIKPGEIMYWMSDMGWMMGPWEVFGTLLTGATMLFYEGAPDYPGPDRLWQRVEEHEITHLGVSPTLIRSLKTHGTGFREKYNLSSLRMVGSTGSPWDPESWLWLFDNVLDSKKPIINYSGGTEISGGIICGNFFTPLKPCAFSGPVPGMDADVVDEQGKPVRGEVGELVIHHPWIGMTRGFWNDRQRYLDTYWSRFENVWVHGDFAAIDEDGLWYILGRSDDTIKIAGKRLGPAEVESLLNAHPAVVESAAIGVPDALKGEELVVFCVVHDQYSRSATLRNDLMEMLTAELGKPLRPREIRFTHLLPKTRNAKVMHRIIRAAYLGNDPGDLSALEDTSAVDAIRLSK